MANLIYQPGDRVQVLGYVHNASQITEMLRTQPVLSVARQMPSEPEHYELSDGRIYRSSELHLVERAASASDPQDAA
jgi:hypothetical protein